MSLGVQDLYPFSTYPMYSSGAESGGARFIALVNGEPREISDFVDWSCPTEIHQLGWWDCPEGPPASPAEHLVKEATDHIAAHSVEQRSADATDASLVVRAWDLRRHEDDTPRDCPVMECSAVEQ